LVVRTTTACETCPFFTVPDGEASLTETTILSPKEAYRLFVPPNTLMAKTSFAPVLSATCNLDSYCNMII
jgi:hypothetical protein